MESNHYIRGRMKQGKDFYDLYRPNGEKLVGLFDLPKLIVLAMEFDKARGIPVLDYEVYERSVWNYSNGVRQYDRED